MAPLGACGLMLLPEEEAALTSAAAPLRRREFAAGRNLARAALTRIGLAPCAIPRADRAPVWPRGAVGSITHTRELVAACVARASDLRGVGIDLERAGRVAGRVRRRILTPTELTDHSVLDADTLRFACKEAIYKAVHPMVGEYFGFQAVKVEFVPENGFVGRPQEEGRFAASVAQGEGRYLDVEGHHLAVFYIP